MTNEEETFRRLFSMSADSLMILNESEFLYCNDATLAMLECTSEEFLRNRHPSDFSPEFQPSGRSTFEVANEQIARAIEHGNQRFEWVHKRFCGEEFIAEVLLSPGLWEAEPVHQALVRDVSESKRLQRDLEAAVDEAERAGAAKLEFLAVMSHEIRTPIHGLLRLHELLLG